MLFALEKTFALPAKTTLGFSTGSTISGSTPAVFMVFNYFKNNLQWVFKVVLDLKTLAKNYYNKF